MSHTICICGSALYYPEGGGHLWVYLNWALGFRAIGCNVIWLERVFPDSPPDQVEHCVSSLKQRLARYGLEDALELARDGQDLPAADRADLLLNFQYGLPQWAIDRFKLSAMLDIDPGLLQLWMDAGQIQLPRHDMYFTIGETVGTPGAKFPSHGIDWHRVRPCVSLEHWPVTPTPPDAAFTTISHWHADEWIVWRGETYLNDKYTAFVPYLDLPRHTTQPLELALSLGGDEWDRQQLTDRGWRVRESSEVSSTPQAYQQYVQRSRGEFSCCKPTCVRLQNAWISDRSICYLASGKPVVVEHTGPSTYLPDDAGLFRFRSMDEAVKYLDTVGEDYEKQSKLARKLAEEYFDARKITKMVLERAL